MSKGYAPEGGQARLAQDLRTFVETGLAKARIPGAAIAIVAGGETVLAEGYGVRDAAGGKPMTADTVYPIASTSKAFNATLIAMLVDDGVLDWDVPVHRYIPGLAFADDRATASATLRDLVAMRTGLPRHDWLWNANPATRADLADRMRHLAFSAGLRERFQYNNLTVTLAGYAAEVQTGEPWETLVQRRILDPLGMRSTVFASPGTDNETRSYTEGPDRKIVPFTRHCTGVTAPSGGAIHSTVADMARWVRFNLAHGCADGRTLVTRANFDMLRMPQAVVPPPPSPAAFGYPNESYGLGWFLGHHGAVPRISHSGFIHNVDSQLLFVPALDVGVIGFTNFGFPQLAQVFADAALDLALGRRPDGSAIEACLADYEAKVAANLERHSAVTRCGVPGSHTPAALCGLYRHPAYGDWRIGGAGEDLFLERFDLRLPLDHLHHELWTVRPHRDFLLHLPHAFDRSSPLRFETGVNGEVAALWTALEPALPPLRLVRVPDTETAYAGGAT